ncbi:D-hexose-6-phosphate mutarotase [Acidovorax carolinensis]|uniref:Putative glucose-6-phosphate 1-epimerase n=1 Tax=Acidovorax carolinensis TaxID=553814 RepID=A0A240UG68_9BURK|nr:D-hexose-6-phosphate mutarotase [Acidovorax carolinensis]ART54309.1 D-hexose-6-phosphate mutarotase [Acidovorax carolinensis]ART60063.1 D-hexose-6-phosphate mutarotase [Acidovorax carolinensis]
MAPDPAVAEGSLEALQGLPCIRLTTEQGDSALVALHGAQVLSWVAGGRERLYLSPRAVFDGKSAIRGGIPLCFPQFNQRGPLPKHGFARNLAWRRVAACKEGDAQSALCLELTDRDATRTCWPERFAAQLTVTLGAGSLRVQLAVHNTGNRDEGAWDFTTALHTYLRVEDVGRAQLTGLDGCARWDALADARGVQQGPVTFSGEYDRVFRAPAGAIHLHDGAHGLQITQSASLSNTVVWNPGAALCARLADLPPDGFRSMLCVEAAQIDQSVTLAPGQPWQGWQELRVLPGPY